MHPRTRRNSRSSERSARPFGSAPRPPPRGKTEVRLTRLLEGAMNQSHAGTRLRVVLGHLSQRLAGVGVSFAVRAARAASVVASRALGTAAQRTLPLPARPRPGVGVSCSGRPRAGRQRSRGRRVPSADSPKLPAGGPACSLGGRVTVPASGACCGAAPGFAALLGPVSLPCPGDGSSS